MTDRGRDRMVAAGVGAAAALAYVLSFHPDWIYDPLRYAQLSQDGPVRVLLGPQHALGNLLPLAAYRAARGLGYGGHAMPVLAAFAVAGAGLAVAAVFFAAVRLGGTRLAAAGEAGVFAFTVIAWRAGGSGGVYGVALASVAIGWLAIARYVLAPSNRRAVALGVAAGAAVASHLENVAFVAGALTLVVLVGGTERWRRAGLVLGAAIGTTAAAFVVTSGVATGWSAGGMWRWIAHPGIGGPADRSSQVGWGGRGLLSAIATGQRALAIAVLLVAGVRLAMLAARSGTGRALAVAAIVNAGGVFLLASWYQALRADYWGLGLVPLAVASGAGTRVFGRRRPLLRAAAVTAALALVGVLVAWNAAKEVAPGLRDSRRNAAIAAGVEAHVPRDAVIAASLLVSGRLADDGYHAEPGFAALRHDDLFGFFTSDAFHLTRAQRRSLRHTALPTPRFVARIGPIDLYRIVGG